MTAQGCSHLAELLLTKYEKFRLFWWLPFSSSTQYSRKSSRGTSEKRVFYWNIIRRLCKFLVNWMTQHDPQKRTLFRSPTSSKPRLLVACKWDSSGLYCACAPPDLGPFRRQKKAVLAGCLTICKAYKLRRNCISLDKNWWQASR